MASAMTPAPTKAMRASPRGFDLASAALSPASDESNTYGLR
jgi:hypothetical protein